ncbi:MULTISPECIES: hypothetical protein [Rhodopirellula]|uniref:hypothetical protein n=1 Tax=Rhodopirellula TaxID=265488 RepID=UPI00257A36EE|nr:hypothetical protein [Rhodopirellula sp. UBA1907]
MSQLYAIGRARLDLLFFNRVEPKRHGPKWQSATNPVAESDPARESPPLAKSLVRGN